MEIKKATLADWDMLYVYFKKIYRNDHPLQNAGFFEWQFCREDYGASYLVIENGEIAGHLGVGISNGFAWHMNLYIEEEFRASPALLYLFKAAKMHGNPASLTANKRLIEIYRKLGWYQYYNLIRLTYITPAFVNSPQNVLLEATPDNHGTLPLPEGYYWQQPGLRGTLLPDGSEGVLQNEVGGIRFAKIVNSAKALSFAWENGYKWVDYITSFNNPILPKLIYKGWKPDYENKIPWLLNPVNNNRFAELPFLTEAPFDIKFYVNRTHADIGRVGSLPNF